MRPNTMNYIVIVDTKIREIVIFIELNISFLVSYKLKKQIYQKQIFDICNVSI